MHIAAQKARVHVTRRHNEIEVQRAHGVGGAAEAHLDHLGAIRGVDDMQPGHPLLPYRVIGRQGQIAALVGGQRGPSGRALGGRRDSGLGEFSRAAFDGLSGAAGRSERTGRGQRREQAQEPEFQRRRLCGVRFWSTRLQGIGVQGLVSGLVSGDCRFNRSHCRGLRGQRSEFYTLQAIEMQLQLKSV